MIKTLLIGHAILALLFVAWLAPRPWRIALGYLFCGCQLLIFTFGVRDAHDLDRLCAGVAGLGLFVLVVHRRRPRAIDTACNGKRSQ
jgi:hypothetical protein